jgi:hypothetical protein
MAKAFDSENVVTLSGLAGGKLIPVDTEFGATHMLRLITYRRTGVGRGYVYGIHKLYVLPSVAADLVNDVDVDTHIRVRGEVRTLVINDRRQSAVFVLGYAILQPAEHKVDSLLTQGKENDAP